MSLCIDTNDVTAVLLADGWHEVANQSFDLDSYEYMADNDISHMLLRGGTVEGVPSTGFIFQEVGVDEGYCCGPLTSILAVRHS